jgi:hypothetical protein
MDTVIIDKPITDRQPLQLETQLETPLWPPQYALRRSRKARNTFLQITKTHGLEIVVPMRQKNIDITQLLDEKRHWIEKTLLRMQPSQTISLIKNEPLPTTIYCKALEETWQVFYQPSPLAKVKLITHFSDKTIWIKGNIEANDLCKKALKKWLIKLAAKYLIPWLQTLSIETKLSFNHAIIRGQSTLWGSCNAKKNISLNYKLLFLPPTLTRHVLLHELCHTKYLNHSQRFWQFLHQFDENSIENKKNLKKAEDYVPAWLEIL